MKAILIFTAAILFSFSFTLADEYIISPSVPDLTPGDGFMEAGSYENPYVIQTESGEEIGTISPQVPDLTPGDGFMEPGSYSNPYVIETD